MKMENRVILEKSFLSSGLDLNEREKTSLRMLISDPGARMLMSGVRTFFFVDMWYDFNYRAAFVVPKNMQNVMNQDFCEGVIYFIDDQKLMVNISGRVAKAPTLKGCDEDKAAKEFISILTEERNALMAIRQKASLYLAQETITKVKNLNGH